MKALKILLPAIAFFAIIFTACGPSKEQQRQQAIEDSIRLEEDRRNLLERANQMLETREEAGEEQASGEGDSAPENP